MRYVVLFIGLVLLASFMIFSGCKAGNVAQFQQKIDEFVSKLDSLTVKVNDLEAKVTELEKAINDLKTNHPELFSVVEKPAEAAPRAEKPAAKPKAPAKPVPKPRPKGGRVK
ncbi:MAG TPA: hypothetical protein ENL24_02130 [candidate division Zixibacteria bacterium]|nr:hypothetical protein [candidate division Zixibacteria bacterium]